MSQPQLQWGQVKRYLERRGYVIVDDGGDKIIQAPKHYATTRPQVRIGHTSTRNAGTPLLKCYISLLKRAFGISVDEIIND